MEDVRRAGGIIMTEDPKGYKVGVNKTMGVDAMVFTFLGMAPLSSGTVDMALVLNILGGFKSVAFLRGFLGMHR